MELDIDHLTGLLNQSALARRVESSEPFTGVVAVCDMDDFKSINDQYGHLVGDEILRNIGHLLRSYVGLGDEAFHWCGDVFVILYQNQQLPEIRLRMLDIRRRLNDFGVRGYGVLPISFSWGAAEAHGEPLRQLLDSADHDMYSHKKRRSARQVQVGPYKLESIPHRMFHCKHCRVRMLLPHEMLGQPFADPAHRSLDPLAVAVACGRCKHIGKYSLLANSRDRDPRDSAVSLDRNADCVFVRWLECEEETCKAHLPLFAQWSAATSAEEQQADTSHWQWQNLRCPAGHSIPKPAGL